MNTTKQSNSINKCQASECSNTFKPVTRRNGKPKMFCSNECAVSTRQAETTCLNPDCSVKFIHPKSYQRKYCSRSCSSLMRMGPPKSKECRRCRVSIASSYTFCGDCWESRSIWRSNDKVKKWVDGDSSVATYANGELALWARNYLLAMANHKCTDCGWNTPNPGLGRPILTIDHVDGNWRNNSYTNVKVLCYNCHTLTPTFGRLNKNSPGNRRRSDNRYTPEPKINTCVDCGVQISVGSLRCVADSNRGRVSKIVWPEMDILLGMLSNDSVLAVSKSLGVSDNSVRKHLQTRGYDPKTLLKVVVDRSDVV